MFTKHLLTLIMTLFIIVSSSAQISITEYSASNLNQFPDNFEKFEDWIEIHNSSTDDVDISGYGISDKESKPQKWLIPDGTTLAAGEYLVVWCSGRDTLMGEDYHTNFKLTQTKGNEFVLLSDPSGAVLESEEKRICPLL